MMCRQQHEGAGTHVKRSDVALLVLTFCIVACGCPPHGVRGDAAEDDGQAQGAPARRQAPTGTSPVPELPVSVLEFLADPAIPPIGVGEAEVTAYEVTADGRALVQCRGTDYSWALSYWPEQGTLVSFSVTPQPWVAQTGVLPESVLRQKALDFVRRWFPAMWDASRCMHARLAYPFVGSDGEVQYNISASDGRISVWGWATVKVSVGSGEVLGASFLPGIPQERMERLVPYDSALQTARTALTWWGGEYASRAVPAHTRCTGVVMPGEERVAWSFMFLPPEGLGPSGFTVTGRVIVDALTGELDSAQESLLDNEQIRASMEHDGDHLTFRVPRLRIDDHHPCWMDAERIAFGTVRPYTGQPEYCQNRLKALAIAHVLGGAPVVVVPAYTRSLTHYAPANGGAHLAAVDAQGEANLLDLRTGVSFAFGGTQRPVEEITCAHTRPIAAFSAHRRQGDRDIFAADLDFQTLAATNQRRLARLEGHDCNPEFSPAEDTVFFAHCPPGGGSHEWEVMRVPVGAPYWDNRPAERVMGGFGEIGRLSFFPDGRQLVVWHRHGLDVVDVEAKTRKPLPLPALEDPDLPGGPALSMRDPTVSPDGTKLAFSGYRDAGDEAEGTGWYIYVCNIDGSEVRRVTPLRNDAVPPYIFPESGRSAFDIAKELALAEMQSED